VPTGNGQVTGRQAILAAMEPVFAIEVVGKLESDGLALTHGRWRLVGSTEGERAELSGRGTIVSRMQTDGSWRIVFGNPLSHA
jgi:ketosteroid isomerase-like protein